MAVIEQCDRSLRARNARKVKRHAPRARTAISQAKGLGDLFTHMEEGLDQKKAGQHRAILPSSYEVTLGRRRIIQKEVDSGNLLASSTSPLGQYVDQGCCELLQRSIVSYRSCNL